MSMVVVEHCLGKRQVKKEADGWLKCILANRIGGYFLFPINGNDSKYDGLFVYDSSEDDMYKIIDSIEIKDFNPIRVVNKFHSFNLVKEINATNEKIINFFVPFHHDSLVINSLENSCFTINLDVRKGQDSREWGRHYEVIYDDENEIVIKFSKKTDQREDRTHGMREFEFYVVVYTDGTIKKVGEWKKRFYEFDQKRRDSCERYVYSAVKINGNNVIISASREKDAAMNENEYIKDNIGKLKEKQRQEARELMGIKLKTKDKEIELAYLCAVNTLNNLTLENGIFAGLPWYHQFWTRDEAISIKAINYHYPEKARKLLMKELENILPDGRVQNIRTQLKGSIQTQLGSADGIGWCVKRLSCVELDKIEKIFVSAKLAYSISKLVECHTKDRLSVNERKETWMDTDPANNDARNGARIEIQAMMLNMYKYLNGISNNKYDTEEEEIRKSVREKFWDGNILFDGANDKTIRPNVFIACYIYPKILKKSEWKKCFENSLPKLWCGWGGLTTIDRTDYRFVDHYTGSEDLSYHRGDSWFWINNLAAIAMSKIDKKSFKKYIEKITEASTKEILYSGIIGSHAELSSASGLSSEGSLMQAWSNAMYIEMIREIYGK